ncbi:MAG: hypothetical protein ABSB29_04230 [Nitrososphaerales archaeon]|jgi:uncharacterized membrane protein YjjB (DUF3815 family)
MTDAVIENLGMILILGLLGLAAYGVSKYTKKHANDQISQRLAEWSIALFSGGSALGLVALVSIGWAIDQGFVAFSNADAAAVITAELLLGIVGFYLSRGRSMIELLRRRREWR